MMASPQDRNSAIGRRLLSNTSVLLYYRMAVLEQTVSELRLAGYHVVQADASRWLSVSDTHKDLSRMFHFPGYYGNNLNAFNDCMRDVVAREYGFPADATGLVMVVTHFDEFAREHPDTAHGLMDIVAAQSRSALLAGEQLVALVQSDDPRFALPPVGAVPVLWNDAEWLNSRRGL